MTRWRITFSWYTYNPIKRHVRIETVMAETIDKAKAVLCTKYRYPIEFNAFWPE